MGAGKLPWIQGWFCWLQSWEWKCIRPRTIHITPPLLLKVSIVSAGWPCQLASCTSQEWPVQSAAFPNAHPRWDIMLGSLRAAGYIRLLWLLWQVQQTGLCEQHKVISIILNTGSTILVCHQLFFCQKSLYCVCKSHLLTCPPKNTLLGICVLLMSICTSNFFTSQEQESYKIMTNPSGIILT